MYMQPLLMTLYLWFTYDIFSDFDINPNYRKVMTDDWWLMTDQETQTDQKIGQEELELVLTPIKVPQRLWWGNRGQPVDQPIADQLVSEYEISL